MGPVWEANHVWLIFVIVVLFTCFPRGYAPLGIALFLPFHLALIGIMLRGASVVFRSYQSTSEEGAVQTSAWGVVFGVASVISPLLMGAAFGVLTEGEIRIDAQGKVRLEHDAPWLSAYCIGNGLLALAACAYLAAVYLTNETTGELQEDFRRRAILAGTSTAILAGVVMFFAWQQANWFFLRMFGWTTLPVIIAGLICFAGSAWAVFTRHYHWARVFAASEIALLLLGWGLAQHPYLIYPDMTLADAAAPPTTLKFLLISLPFGAAALLPSLWFLFYVFKAERKAA
jgi:cytochrome d ubiquinol oxidase subunit II